MKLYYLVNNFLLEKVHNWNQKLPMGDDCEYLKLG